MTRVAALAVALGGAAGAALRWGVITATGPTGGFPWAVLALNLVGSFLLGVALARAHGVEAPVWWRDAIGIGFCGGLTTFSTFAVEAAELVRDDRAVTAAAYVASSVVLAMAAVWVGAAVAGRPDAVDDPLEAAA